MDTSFYVSWLGPPAFGTTASQSYTAPAPPAPVVAPIPIASFDFNKYVAGDSTLVNDISGGSSATINEPLANTYVSDLSNSYLSIYAPDNYPSQTGGITLPNLSNITAIELWLRYPSLGYYGQYFLDARTGSGDSYYIVSDSGVDISGAWLGGTGYLNTLSTTIDNTGPNVATTLANDLSGGWCQLIILPSTSISDDVACFMRYTGEQGMPVDIAEILVYDASITSEMVVLMYNARCERYGLSPIAI
jgi:hypothetical protein